MKKTLPCILFLALSINVSMAQTAFEKMFGGTGVGAAIGGVQTSDEGFAVAGYIYANGITGLDLCMVKYDATGNIMWHKTYGGLMADYTNGGFQQTRDNGFVLLGYTNSPTTYNSEMLKLDANGDTMWTRVFQTGSSTIYLQIQNIHQTKDGGYILAGTYYEEDSIEASYAVLIRIDGNGNTKWSKTYYNATGGSYEIISGGYDVLETSDNGFVMTAYGESSFINSTGYGPEYDINLFKTDSTGNVIWAQEINLDASGGFSFLQQSNDGGYALTEVAESYYGYDSTYLVKTDSHGNLLWTKNYYTDLGGLSDANLMGTANGEYILYGGLSNLQQSGIYGHVIKTNGIGDTLWTRRFGPQSQSTQFSSLYESLDGSYFFTGANSPGTSQGAAPADMYIVKTDSNGHTACTGSFDLIETQSFSPAEQDIAYFYSSTFAFIPGSWNLIISSGGTESYACYPNGITDVNPVGEISIYPNPAIDLININIPSNTVLSSIEVFDMTGRKVIGKNISNASGHYTIDLGGNAAGYYFMRLNTLNGIVNKSFVLQ